MFAADTDDSRSRFNGGPPSRVIVVTDSLDVDGGSGKVALTSARALAERGISTTVFAASGTNVGDVANLTFESTEQGTVLGDPALVSAALRGLYNFTARRRLRALLATCDPRETVVHVHGWTKALSASIFDAIADAKIPSVVTLHEYFLACPTGSLYLHKEQQICHLRPMSVACVTRDCDSRSYAHKAYRVARQLVQRELVHVPRDLRFVATVSDFSAGVLASLLPQGTRIAVVPNPVDAPHGERAAAEDNEAFVFVGRLSAEKGAPFFAAAARAANVEAIFVGDGEERAEIERLNPDARITGWVAPARVYEYLRTARSIVVPSLWYETFGLVVAEGMALGIPSIVPSGTAPGESIEDGRTGTLFERGDRDDLCEKMRRHADNGYVRRLSGNAYQTYWERPYTVERHIQQLLTMYDQVRESFFSSP